MIFLTRITMQAMTKHIGSQVDTGYAGLMPVLHDIVDRDLRRSVYVMPAQLCRVAPTAADLGYCAHLRSVNERES